MKTELNEAISATFIHNTCNRDSSSSSRAALFWKRETKHFLRRPQKSNLRQIGKIIEREIHLFCHVNHYKLFPYKRFISAAAFHGKQIQNRAALHFNDYLFLFMDKHKTNP